MSYTLSIDVNYKEVPMDLFIYDIVILSIDNPTWG